MKKLQTILASLALAGTSVVATSGQSNADKTSLDSLVDNNNTSRVELMQDKKEKTVAEQIFDTNYKGKIIKVKSTIDNKAKDGKIHEDKAIYEFTENMSDSINPYINGSYFGLTAKGMKTLRILTHNDDALLFESFARFPNAPDTMVFMYITSDPATKKPVISNLLIDGDKTFKHAGLAFTLEEFSKKEYDEVDKFRKGIIGKYEAKKLYELKDGERYVVKLDKAKDHENHLEQEHTATKTDPETGKETKHRVYVDYRKHVPLELEFNDKGEMIYNPSKYKNPYKTVYVFDIANNEFIYRTPMEVLKVMPEKEEAIFKKKRDEFGFGENIIPIFEPNGQMSLEYQIKFDNGVTHVYTLERVK